MTLLVVVAAVLVVAAAVRGVFSPCGLSMISAITPFSERARGNAYGWTAAWFVAGAVGGGLLLGGLGGAGALLGRLVDDETFGGPPVLALASVCALVALAADLPGLAFRLPLHPRQVNERWMAGYRRWVYAAGFGAQIGTGFATYIMTAATYLVPVYGALTGSVPTALALGAGFGAARGAAVLLSCRATDPHRLRRLHAALAVAAPWTVRATVVLLALAAVLLAGAAAGVAGAAVAALIAAVLAAASMTRRRPSDRTEPEPALV
ncbi:hypothetical protein JL107_12435 [Nakamurella flavida]|uniref:Sulfite exporter TauE/SafE family protein n=1 Tax=Nakamurella flavida TaxID=363630 RepID=A0A938YPT0_9ACTN|nr:hypothetical protein [Nakamurella flavida]MBM9477252.1 hypothetical protein [Nakamurella flavida]MDP9779708.1 MFS family permease [Nakamurella flavida]